MNERERQEELERQRRHFDTTQGSDFTQKGLQENTVGRRVMKTQDCQPVSFDERDEQLIVEHGTWRRLQKTTDDDLTARIPKGDYHQQQPVTHWTHT